MPGTLRVALLGGGKMAHQHAAAIRQCRDAKLVAVVDPHVVADELKQKFGAEVATFTDAQAMLSEIRPDVVHVVTPPASHAALARQCLEAGANVYVEKPFALTTADAESILRLADAKGLKACAAHQVLFQESGRRYRKHLPMIGKIIHVESFFSFRPVRRRTAGGPSTPVDQLIDILPHPVYLLLDALPDETGARAEVTALDVSIEGEVRAVIRKGDALGNLVVSLRARPVESWLRVMGANGMVEADFVLSNVIRHPGPGASAISVVLKPFSRAWQMGWGSFKSVLKLIFRRHKSYPGLAELLSEFYESVRHSRPAPVQEWQILDTVRICELIAARIKDDLKAAEDRAIVELRARESKLPPLNNRGVILLTGGTGLLGRPTAWLLRQRGWHVRIPVRRTLGPQEMLPGVEYCTADLSIEVSNSLLDGVDTVVHLAAETAGTLSDHERNTVRATRNLLGALQSARTRKFIGISTVAVLKPSRTSGYLTEDSPIDSNNLARGPYVWAKAAAELLATDYAKANNLELRMIRLGPLVDYSAYQPPGRLGREIGRLFVSMGNRSKPIFVSNLRNAARVICYTVETIETAPICVNFLDSPPPTRGELVQQLRMARPDLRVFWLPFWLLSILNIMFLGLQRIAKPGKVPLDLYAAFRSERYETDVAKDLDTRSRIAISEL